MAGFGLVEALIAGALALLLLGLLHRFLVPVMQANARTSVKVHLRQQATVSLDKFTGDMTASSAHTVSYLAKDPDDPNSPIVVALTRLDSVTSTGTPLYQDYLTVYVWKPDKRQLIQKRCPPEPPNLKDAPSISRAVALSPEELQQLAATDNGTERILAGEVTLFDPFPDWPVSSPAKLRIRLEKDVPGRTAPEVLELERVVRFRN